MVPVPRPQTVGIAGVTGQCFRVGNARKKGRKNLLAPYFSTRRRYKTRRDTTGLVRANESSSSSETLSGRVEAERKTQSTLSRAYRCRAGRLERIRPYLNGSLSLFPSSSLTTAPPPFSQTHTHRAHFLPHHHTHPLPLTPSLHHFSGMRRHFLSRLY